MTIIEILVVVGIIALLVGMLIPALTMVRRTAKEVKQKAQFTAIDLGLAAFKNDYGDYPPSFWWVPPPATPAGVDQRYCGTQKLAEAMLGWDLLGFHPNSAWRSDGLDSSGGDMSYDPARTRDVNNDGVPDTLTERRDRYVELETANAFRLGQSAAAVPDGLFLSGAGAAGSNLEEDTYVLCDVFEVPQRKVLLSDGKTVNPGTPILYYKANTASKLMVDPATAAANAAQADLSIYRARDNSALLSLGRLADGGNPVANRRTHALSNWGRFYEFIRDPKVLAQPWPYRPDSYILISAGWDGEYGTNDDICNFPR